MLSFQEELKTLSLSSNMKVQTRLAAHRMALSPQAKAMTKLCGADEVIK